MTLEGSRWSPGGFYKTLQEHQVSRLIRKDVTTIQVNIGKLCNQACQHCHVEAGPGKLRENMDRAGIDRLISLLAASPEVQTVDITGGAPELNPFFRTLVTACREFGKEVIDRCNLTVLHEKGQEDTVDFLATSGAKVVASLPCYSSDNVDKQRGDGVFIKSIEALQKLNAAGYGKGNSGLRLDLVYNPIGAYLPPPQKKLEEDYRARLKNDFGIEFNHLYCITNMPIKRFLRDLQRQNKLEEYMALLLENFNPAAAEGVMCRSMISISWDGKLFDCDFNQMLDIPSQRQKTVWDIESFAQLASQPIMVDAHCYGCTAGAGSSCGGTLT